MKALNRIVENARLAPMRIVLCEAGDARVLAAARELAIVKAPDDVTIGS